MSTPEPIWNADGHLDQVYRRGRRLRNRRRLGAVAGGTLAAVALVAAVAGLVGVGGSNGPQRVVTAGSGRPAGSVTSAAGGPGGNGGATSPSVTTIPSSGGGVGVGTPTSNTATTTKARVTTNPGTATTGPSATTTTTTGAHSTTTTVAGGNCGAAELAYTTVTDQRSYSGVAPISVAINLVVTNVSGHTCNGPSNAGISAYAVVKNSSGAQVFKSNPIGISCTATCAPPVLVPGGTASYGAGSWDNAGPPGSYSAVAIRLGASGSPASFTIR